MVITGTLACLKSSESQELEEEHLRLMEMQQEEDELLHRMLMAAIDWGPKFQLPRLGEHNLFFPVQPMTMPGNTVESFTVQKAG